MQDAAFHTPVPWEVSPAEVRARLAAEGDQLQLIDCREEVEVASGSLTGSLWIPLSDFVARFRSAPLQEQDEIVVFCHLGARSLQVVQWLRQQGFARAQSMSGGIEQWNAECRHETTEE